MSIEALPIDIYRLWNRIDQISAFTRPDVPWTRRAFSEEFSAARTWLTSQFVEAGLTVSLDASANLIGRREGTQVGLSPLVSGSHSDTVVGGGRFDGIIGTLAALEIAHSLSENGVVLRHPLEVVDFLSEEPSDYGVSCVGSRAMTGRLSIEMLGAVDPGGETLALGINRMGGNAKSIQMAKRTPGSVAAFVELHIEQGPVLESHALPIGVVTNIVGIRRVAISVTGQPDHAGTTPMDLRKDALVGAARLIDKAFTLASALSGKPHYVVATVGRLHLTPNVPNAVPGVVEMVLEVRSDSDNVLNEFPERLLNACHTALIELKLNATLRQLTRGSPTDCAPTVIECIEQASADLGYHAMRMPSGAGHDAVYMTDLGPSGMIFVPCLNGRSHCPEEWLDRDQLAAGVAVLARSIMLLDNMVN